MLSLRSVIRRSLQLLPQRDRILVWLVVAFQVISSLLDILGVLLIGVVVTVTAEEALNAPVDRTPGMIGALSELLRPYLLWLSLVAVAILLGKSLLNFLLLRRIFRFLAHRQAFVAESLSKQLLNAPLLFVQQRSSQATAYALTIGVRAAVLGVLGQMVVVVSEIGLLVLMSIALFFIDWQMTIFLVVLFTGVAFFLNRFLSKWAHEVGHLTRTVEIEELSSMQQALGAYRELTVLHRRSNVANQLGKLRWDAAYAQASQAILTLTPKMVFEVAIVLGASAFIFIQLLASDLPTALGLLAVFLAAASRMMPSLLRLQTSVVQLQTNAALANASFELADELNEANVQVPGQVWDSKTYSRPLHDLSILCDRLTFRYPNSSTFALDSVTFHVPHGSSLAIVGPSGAGKSTLADLLLGILEPTGGRVTIGGMPPLDFVQRKPGSVAYVPQRVGIFDTSVMENVAIGLAAEDIDAERVYEALCRSGLRNDLETWEEGVRQRVGEQGLLLSGGQRQRLGLARALYANPEILLLDEATSALDSETEDLVSNAIRDLAGSVTRVIIAHRLATVRDCDLVLYLEDGRVEGVGSFEEVRERVPRFERQARLLGL